MKILNYQDAQIRRIDLTSADFVVREAAITRGNGVYWYPDHDFNVVVPNLSVRSPQAVKHYTQTNRFPGGMGYFAENEPALPPLPIPDTERPEPPA
ncbi:MAG: hypothetical protein GYA23_05330 [Methanomicrobiales archaeon]|nr:hypothetical protein [Methanomicrobiales archaeon]